MTFFVLIFFSQVGAFGDMVVLCHASPLPLTLIRIMATACPSGPMVEEVSLPPRLTADPPSSPDLLLPPAR
jgi:hypothetical protein